MMNLSSFDSFMVRVRAGDEEAACDLVSRFGNVIRREVRLRMYDRRFLRVLDSMDIVQSVLNSFFARAAAGQFALESPEQLAKLLIAMTRNKVAFQRRREYSQRRDSRKIECTPVDEIDVIETDPGPTDVVSNRDLFDKVCQLLTPEERWILNLRAEGLEWTVIADRLGGSSQSRRMQLARAVHRISQSLRTDESHG